ncbi:MAG: glutathione S-transferase C-terminal domain-containing protein [Synechococcus sp. ELA057]
MAPPALLVRSARGFWHCQWRQLMGGLGPADREGRYRRPVSPFTQIPSLPVDADQASAHVLIVGRSCPWAHRAWLVHRLRRLEGSIDLVVVEPDPAAGRWRFPVPFEGCSTLAELYRGSGAAADQRATVPVLWSRRQGRIVLGESAQLIELLDQWPSASGMRLAPADRLEEINAWRQRLQGDVNDGVYRCGFARTQAAYDEAEAALFAALEAVERELDRRQAQGESWLCGPEPTLADVILFPTLVRLELVYAPLFGVSRRPLWQLPALWRWRSRFHRLDGVAATCFPAAWRQDYFGALFPLHPSGIIPAAPDLESLLHASPLPPAAPLP